VNRDHPLALLRDGYRWAGRRRGGAVAVPTRLLGRRAAVVGGPDGVRRFYDPGLRRRGAVPLPVRRVLFGAGAVHGLDDAEHRHRKALFLRVLTPGAVAALGRATEREWRSAERRWAAGGPVVLFDEAVQVIAAAVLPWAGVSAPAGEVPRRARQLAEVVDGFATPGRPYARAAVARWRLNRWCRRLVEQVRAGSRQPAEGTALHAAAGARDLRGRLLPARVAAVELLNVLRPTVAVAWFVAFAGVALQEQPGWRQRIAGGDEAALAAFAQEVRRYYPFVPVLAARTRYAQDVAGVAVPRGGFVLLDVYGTDHDPARWPDPGRFDPDRFLRGTVDPDTLVPQGGGDVATGHRCPGENVVLTLLAVAVSALSAMPYQLPPQDLHVDQSRVPTRPRSGVLLVAGAAVGDRDPGRGVGPVEPGRPRGMSEPRGVPSDDEEPARPTPLGTPPGTDPTMPSGADQVTVPYRDEAQAARRMDWGDPADAPGAEPDSARAAETPPHPDAERLESALREAGTPGPADAYAEQRRQRPTEEGPGTSLP
jgi:fatty-acid peroxygenase